ncbi:MAG: hypothetical protein R3B89_26630 [Polyangiaceae bacterium]
MAATADAARQARKALEISATRAFFIDETRLLGAQPCEEFQVVIERKIEQAPKLIAAGPARAELDAARCRESLGTHAE